MFYVDWSLKRGLSQARFPQLWRGWPERHDQGTILPERHVPEQSPCGITISESQLNKPFGLKLCFSAFWVHFEEIHVKGDGMVGLVPVCFFLLKLSVLIICLLLFIMF